VTVVAAALLGYLVGSLPTANALARLWGVDLRTGGSRNPGANNARRLGGLTLSLVVLVVEVVKGVAAVVIGWWLAGDPGAVAAGLGAITGNVYNVWYSFQGGKGLAITLEVLLGIWPTVVPFVLLILALAAALTRSSGIGTLITLVFLLTAAVTWETLGLGTAWGVEDLTLLPLVGAGVALVLFQRHFTDARARLRAPAHL